MKKDKINRVAVSEGERAEFEELKKIDPKAKTKIIFSFFPCDKWDCECQPDINDLKVRFANMTPKEVGNLKYKMEYLKCPRKKLGMTKYKIICNNCDEQVGQFYAREDDLNDWCDLHYISSHDGQYWQGAQIVNISPIDGAIGFECACGVDTRDFRANATLKGRQLLKKIAETKKGRLFNQEDSKFRLEPIVVIGEQDSA